MKDKAYLACGCFWGSQALFSKLPGVITTQVGYMGGTQDDAHYDIIKHGHTLHKEVVEVLFDASIIDYNHILQYFFEIHDFTQTNGQGPDIGEQYLSVIFYLNDEQKLNAEDIIALLSSHNYPVATKLLPAMPFYPAEIYHQNYYANNGLIPYCHLHRPLFNKLTNPSEP